MKRREDDKKKKNEKKKKGSRKRHHRGPRPTRKRPPADRRRKRRGSEDIKRDQLVEAVLRENRCKLSAISTPSTIEFLVRSQSSANR